jgi:hypothetical protein
MRDFERRLVYDKAEMAEWQLGLERRSNRFSFSDQSSTLK